MHEHPADVSEHKAGTYQTFQHFSLLVASVIGHREVAVLGLQVSEGKSSMKRYLESKKQAFAIQKEPQTHLRGKRQLYLPG